MRQEQLLATGLGVDLRRYVYIGRYTDQDARRIVGSLPFEIGAGDAHALRDDAGPFTP